MKFAKQHKHKLPRWINRRREVIRYSVFLDRYDNFAACCQEWDRGHKLIARVPYYTRSYWQIPF